jgi:hypothetical protein
MTQCKRSSYIGGNTVLTQSRSGYEAEMAKAAQRHKRRAQRDQERFDEERRQKLQRRLDEIAKFAPRREGESFDDYKHGPKSKP